MGAANYQPTTAEATKAADLSVPIGANDAYKPAENPAEPEPEPGFFATYWWVLVLTAVLLAVVVVVVIKKRNADKTFA